MKEFGEPILSVNGASFLLHLQTPAAAAAEEEEETTVTAAEATAEAAAAEPAEVPDLAKMPPGFLFKVRKKKSVWSTDAPTTDMRVILCTLRLSMSTFILKRLR